MKIEENWQNKRMKNNIYLFSYFGIAQFFKTFSLFGLQQGFQNRVMRTSFDT